MKLARLVFRSLVALCTALPVVGAATAPFLHAPSVDTYATHNPAGRTILSNGRYLTPIGNHFPAARDPHGLAMSRDGKRLFVASDGSGQLVEDWQGNSPKFIDVKVPPLPNRKVRGNTGGVDFSADGALLYWSGGDSGTIMVYDTTSRAWVGDVKLNTTIAGRAFEDSYAVDVKVSEDGRWIYCADVTNFRLIVLDAQTRQLVSSVPVGRYPYALALAGNHVYAANIGLFEYSPIPPPKGKGFDPRGLTRPAFGFPGREARDGVEFEGRKVPGLGDANVPESFSVWGVDVTEALRPRVASRLKTGILVGEPADNGKTVGGSAPNYLCVRGDSMFVSNGNNDLIERVDLKRNQVVAKVRLTPSPLVAGLRGVLPAGMVLSPDGSRLYVAEMSINAIAVLDTRTLQVLGHIPTAWYPYRVALSPDGRKLAVICFRGFGNGPNAGQEIPRSDFLGLKGVLSLLEVPSAAALSDLTTQVLRNNGIENHPEDRAAMSSPVVPMTPGKASAEIKYVVFITKENHSFDAIFDRVPGARHDPSLLRWGLHQTIQQKGQPTLEDVGVMVNHNALARQFSLSDNFYMEPEASGVGHRWLVGVQPNNLKQ